MEQEPQLISGIWLEPLIKPLEQIAQIIRHQFLTQLEPILIMLPFHWMEMVVI